MYFKKIMLASAIASAASDLATEEKLRQVRKHSHTQKPASSKNRDKVKAARKQRRKQKSK